MRTRNSHALSVALRATEAEVRRQKQLKAEGRFEHTCRDRQLTDQQRLAILVEEVGEVARAICDRDPYNLGEELTQVAAIAVDWLAGRYIREEHVSCGVTQTKF